MQTLLDEQALRRRRRINRMHSFALLASQFALLGLVGWIVAGGVGLSGLVAGGAAVFMFGPRLRSGLALRWLGVRPVAPEQAPQLMQAVAALARRAGLSTVPKLGYRPSYEVNAFTVGRRDDAIIVVTEGLLRALGGRELVGVLAHEVSHIAGNDLAIMALADVAVKMTGFMGRLGILLILLGLTAALIGAPMPSFALIAVLVAAPLASALVQLALSRTREFEADANAARITGDPRGLMSALARISQLQGDAWERLVLPGRRGVEPSVLRTHPRTKERLRRLRELIAPAETPGPLDLAGLERGWAGRPGDFPSPRSPRWRLGGWW